MVALDEAFAALAVGRSEIEAARLAGELGGSGQHVGLLSRDQAGASLTHSVDASQDPAFARLGYILLLDRRFNRRDGTDVRADGP